MLEKIKELRVKAECAKALLALADDETDLNAIDDENSNPLFDELAEQKGAN